MLKIRGAEISMIFQEPMSALNPTMKIGKQLSEVYKIHQAKSNFNIQKKIKQLIKKVKLEKVENILQKYPHERDPRAVRPSDAQLSRGSEANQQDWHTCLPRHFVGKCALR